MAWFWLSQILFATAKFYGIIRSNREARNSCSHVLLNSFRPWYMKSGRTKYLDRWRHSRQYQSRKLKNFKNTDHTNYGCLCHEKLRKKSKGRGENQYLANKKIQNYLHTRILYPSIHERLKLLTLPRTVSWQNTTMYGNGETGRIYGVFKKHVKNRTISNIMQQLRKSPMLFHYENHLF